jgi:hypothetical protein
VVAVHAGRKHQLRVHCARVLGAPIIGDTRYGYEGLTPSPKLAQKLHPEWWQAFSPQTAHDALNPPTRRERRQAAAARHRATMAAAAAAATSQRVSAPAFSSGSDGDGDSDGLLVRARGGVLGRDGVTDGNTSCQPEGVEGTAPGSGAEVCTRKQALRCPVFLHSRRMLVKVPGEAAVRVSAPLPAYMADMIAALGWPLPPS